MSNPHDKAIDEMQAGRDLDSLVAENVMGWTRKRKYQKTFPNGYNHYLYAPGEDISPRGSCFVYMSNNGRLILANDGSEGSCNSPIPPCVPQYSTNIAAAWEVLSRFNGTSFHLSFHQRYEGPEPWSVQLWVVFAERKDEAMAKKLEARGKTAPHAICLAALKAVDA